VTGDWQLLVPRSSVHCTAVDVTPAGVLAMWASGLGGGVAFVAHRRMVGRGYVWLGVGVTALFGVTAGAAGGSWPAYGGSACVLAANLVAARPVPVMALSGTGSALLLAAAIVSGLHPVLVVTGALALGAVTTEMMLGHWYLVDPRLPRPVLRLLAVVGAAGAAIDGIVVAALGAVPWSRDATVMGVGFLALALATTVLMALVYSSLGERGYAGVMAATGLSYLAVLTGTGAVVLGRMLV
jgi:hypothetical protein